MHQVIQRSCSASQFSQAKEQSDVWKKTEAEFNVQKMIWQSLSLSGFQKKHRIHPLYIYIYNGS